MTDTGQQTTEERFVWGIWATLGWVIIALVVSLIAAFVPLLLMRPEAITGTVDILKDGALLSVTTIVSATVQVGVLALAARLARWPAAEYLALVWPARRDLIIAFACLATFVLAYDALTYLLGRDIVTPFQVDTYRSARESGTLPLLWITLVIAAPVAEEIIFRGFLFRGWVTSPRSAVPAILLISALFAIIHLQYDWFGILQVFFIGLVLAWARWWTGSTLLTILMHALINLWATVQTLVKVDWLS
jgi:membrane protease YdiL (CAAX protease family)